jgi:hypothetical protein
MNTSPEVFTRDTVTSTVKASDFCDLTRDICRDKACQTRDKSLHCVETLNGEELLKGRKRTKGESEERAKSEVREFAVADASHKAALKGIEELCFDYNSKARCM